MTREEAKEYYKNIGRNLRFYRNNNKLTLAEIGKVLEVSTQQYQKYEAGNTKLPAKYLTMLSKYYNVSLTAFVETKVIEEQPEKATSVDIGTNMIPRKLKAFRTLNYKTQSDIANILGVTYQQYQKYETGANRTPIASLQILANEYKVSLDELITGNKITFSFDVEPKE